MMLFGPWPHVPSIGLESRLCDTLYHAWQHGEGKGRIEPFEPVMMVAAPHGPILTIGKPGDGSSRKLVPQIGVFAAHGSSPPLPRPRKLISEMPGK